MEKTDILLWASFKNGDRESFACLFRQNYQLLYLYGSRILADKDILEDCIQEMFLQLWQTRERASHPISVKAYLLKCLKVRLIKAKAIQNKQISFQDEHIILPEYSHESLLIARQTEIEVKRQLSCSLKFLSKRQQQAVYLKFYGRMSYEEMSSVMAVNYQTARNLIHQSIKILREKMIMPMIIAVLLFVL